MINSLIPEKRITNIYDNCWKRIKLNGGVEYYNKEYYNPDYTRKITNGDIIESIKRELLLSEIDKIL
jgi:hypothetical protein